MGQTKLRKRCGAKRKDGSPCMAWAMANGRCRIHGGKKKKGASVSQVTHGIYATGYLPDELDTLPYIPLGSLDQEIQVLKLQLKRAVHGQSLYLQARGEEEKVGFFELDSLEQSTAVPLGTALQQTAQEGNGEHHEEGSPNDPEKKIIVSEKKVRKRKNYLNDILKIANVIGKLEMQRAEIRLKLPPDDFNYNELGKQIAKELEERDLA